MLHLFEIWILGRLLIKKKTCPFLDEMSRCCAAGSPVASLKKDTSFSWSVIGPLLLDIKLTVGCWSRKRHAFIFRRDKWISSAAARLISFKIRDTSFSWSTTDRYIYFLGNVKVEIEFWKYQSDKYRTIFTPLEATISDKKFPHRLNLYFLNLKYYTFTWAMPRKLKLKFQKTKLYRSISDRNRN